MKISVYNAAYIQAEVVALCRLRTKDAISLKCLEQEAGQWRNHRYSRPRLLTVMFSITHARDTHA